MIIFRFQVGLAHALIDAISQSCEQNEQTLSLASLLGSIVNLIHTQLGSTENLINVTSERSAHPMFSCVPVQMEVSRYGKHQALQVSRQQLLQTLHHMDTAVSKLNLAQEFALGKLTSKMQP